MAENKDTRNCIACLPAFLLIFLACAGTAIAFAHKSKEAVSIEADNKIKFSLKQGEIKQYPLKFTNTGKLRSYINLAVEALKGLLVPNKEIFELDPQKTGEASLIVFAPNNQMPGIYEGKVLIKEIRVQNSSEKITANAFKSDKVSNVIKSINSVIDISTKNVLFEFSLIPKKINESAVEVEISILNIGAPPPADISFELYAKKIGGDIIGSEIKRVNLRDSISYSEVLKVNEDEFLIYGKLRHNGEVIVRSVYYNEEKVQKISKKESFVKKIFSKFA